MSLTSQTFKSKSTPLTDVNWDDIKKEMPSSTIVCWLFDKLLFGTIDDKGNGSFTDGTIVYPDKENIIEIRVFNPSKEIYLRKNSDKFIGRTRTDSEGDDTTVTDTENYLWGTKSEVDDGYTYLTEANGMHLHLPGEFQKVSPDKRVNLVIRNYIGYNDRHMAGYVDARFVEIKMN